MESPNDSFNPLTKSDIPYIDGELEAMNTHQDGPDSNRPTNGTKDDESPPVAPRPPAVLSMFGRFSFPFLLASSVVQLSIYLNKLYQDSSAVEKYYAEKDNSYCLVSSFCLFLPALIYIMYIVSAYVKDQEEVESKEVGTKVVHGMLLVPWQIKSRLEVLQFSAQRICQRRFLTADELEEKSRLDRNAAVLEFFEEFYAGLTQLLLQLYIIIKCLDKKIEYQALTGEIIASGLTLISMLAAVRRRDDGILTGFLSITGWLSITISRAIAIAMATTVIHGWMILACILHGVLISLWVASIAMKTYYSDNPSTVFTWKRKMAMFFLIFSVFGLPSLTYWPIMFELKKHKRPLIFLFVLLLENVLFVGLWVCFKEETVWGEHDHALVFLAGGFFVLGSLFVVFYICCKPKYTDHVVYHDMKVRNADSFGMYFEFCDVAFKLTRKKELETKLKEVREHRMAHHP